MIIVRLLSPGLWLVGTTKVYPAFGADIVMESITLIENFRQGRNLAQWSSVPEHCGTHGSARRTMAVASAAKRMACGVAPNASQSPLADSAQPGLRQLVLANRITLLRARLRLRGQLYREDGWLHDRHRIARLSACMLTIRVIFALAASVRNATSYLEAEGTVP
jgi:hypothetical protein